MAGEKKEKSNTGKLIIIVVAIIAILGGGTFGGMYFYFNKTNAAVPAVVQIKTFELGEIFVNLSDEGAKRYVKLTLNIGYDKENTELATELEENKVILRDTANFYLKSCKAKSFDPVNEAILKGDLVGRLNQKLKSGLIMDVYISDIIVQ